MKNREQEIVTILPNELNIQNQPWCREARLVYVNGSGALKWEHFGDVPDHYWGACYLSRLTLNGTPLLSRRDSGCPTCESLLATGWGLEEANAPELEAARLGRTVSCLTILPASVSYQPLPGGKLKPLMAWFGQIVVPMQDMCGAG